MFEDTGGLQSLSRAAWTWTASRASSHVVLKQLDLFAVFARPTNCDFTAVLWPAAPFVDESSDKNLEVASVFGRSWQTRLGASEAGGYTASAHVGSAAVPLVCEQLQLLILLSLQPVAQ